MAENASLKMTVASGKMFTEMVSDISAIVATSHYSFSLHYEQTLMKMT